MSENNVQHRISYIDQLKGFAILWIIWWHTCHPAFVEPYYHVPLFFFISGIFFKDYPFRILIKKRVHTLLIPFFFFYLIGYLFRIIVFFWDHKTISGFPWEIIFDVFKCFPNGDYLGVNVPIWFLLCLFNVNIIYFFLAKLPKWFSIVYIIIVLFLTNTITQISTPFFFNDAIKWTAYFAIGNIVGPKYMELLQNKKTLIFLLLLTLTLFFTISFLIPNHTPNIFGSFIDNTLTIFFIFAIFALFTLMDGKKILNPLLFYGNNSLIILGIHVPVLIVFQRLAIKLWGVLNYWSGFGVFVATSLLMIAVVPLMKKLFPHFLAR